MDGYGGAISLSQVRDLSRTSDEDEKLSPRSAPPLVGQSRTRITINNRACGGSALVMRSASEITTRKPRGRPPGSKNKPKPPIVLARESESAMKTAILEISAGSDIIETVVQFARGSHLGVSVVSGSGSVTNVTLRHPASHAPALTLHGPFNLLSLTGTVLGSPPPSSSSPSSSPSPSSSSSSSSCNFAISLAGQQGQVFGGVVGGKVMAASPVVLVVATFSNPSFHRLPVPVCKFEEAADHPKPRNGGGGASEDCSSTSMSMSAFGVSSPVPLNSQAPPEIFSWGPTSMSRPPSQPY